MGRPGVVTLSRTSRVRGLVARPRMDERESGGGGRGEFGAVRGVEIAVRDNKTWGGGGGGGTISRRGFDPKEPLHLLVDSTGLKIYGEGEWLDQKHSRRSRRRWRKLHLGVDADT